MAEFGVLEIEMRILPCPYRSQHRRRKRFVVRTDEILTASLELEAATRAEQRLTAWCCRQLAYRLLRQSG
jgi:hypothetical protein